MVPLVGTVGAKNYPHVAYILAKEVIHSMKKNKARERHRCWDGKIGCINNVVREGLSNMNLNRNLSDNKEPTMRRSERSVSDEGKSRCKGAGVERLSRLGQGVHKIFCKEPDSI